MSNHKWCCNSFVRVIGHLIQLTFSSKKRLMRSRVMVPLVLLFFVALVLAVQNALAGPPHDIL